MIPPEVMNFFESIHPFILPTIPSLMIGGPQIFSYVREWWKTRHDDKREDEEDARREAEGKMIVESRREMDARVQAELNRLTALITDMEKQRRQDLADIRRLEEMIYQYRLSDFALRQRVAEMQAMIVSLCASLGKAAPEWPATPGVLMDGSLLNPKPA